MTCTSEWEQRSHCGCHTHSSLRSPFALPAVSPSPPTAVAIHQANLNSTHTHTNAKYTPSGTHVLGASWVASGAWLRKIKRKKLFLPAGCSLPLCHTDWVTALRHSVIHLHHQQPISITPIHTATTHELTLATPGLIFKAFSIFVFWSAVSQMSGIFLLLSPAHWDSLPNLHYHTLLPQCPPLIWQMPCAQLTH